MATLARKFKKIFGSASSNNGVFGSKAADAPATSLDPAVIESLAAFENGLDAATISGNKLLAAQDLQGLKYDTDYHLAYIYQEGLQVYDIATAYSPTSIVRQPSTSIFWKSLVDNNVGNALVEGANWTKLGDLASLRNIVQATETVLGVAKLATQANTIAGTAGQIVDPQKLLGLFSASLRGSEGSINLPINLGGAFSNIIFKFGVLSNVALNETFYTVTFATAFPNAILNVQASVSMTSFISGVISTIVKKGAITTSSIQICGDYSDNTATGDIYWMAIGY